MKGLVCVFVCVLACVLTGSVQADVLGLPIAGAEVNYTAFVPIGGGESITLPTLTLRPYADTGPATPGKLDELLPWAKSNLAFEVPFEGDESTFLRARGFGISEAVEIGTMGGIPVRAGLAWVSGAGTCAFVRAGVWTLSEG